MKKTVALVLAIIIISAMFSCGISNVDEITNNSSQNIAETDIITLDSSSTESPVSVARTTPYTDKDVDIDFSSMNSIILSSCMYDVEQKTADYIGQVFKLDGMYFSYYDYVLNEYFPAISITKAASCCAAGAEFILVLRDESDSALFPEPYEDFTVIGRFDTFFDGEFVCFRLSDVEIVK
ncbi:MAG: hypothetical protein IJR55_02220 [Clostridia bacterium]|nr:hypothetical protein [Clostridia bacterium]